ncbi:hypothetical protein C4D60_Mb04t37880 [Musa balbisiana]|uniref:Uncharacterized protein n=1 Tax=Musa balbisiana TaxID=52838 RepID=A0A4S8KHJ7_MUSBA|nr:hypothetical protein C4D60_Mb04t37880 [Musa balbisiana]
MACFNDVKEMMSSRPTNNVRTGTRRSNRSSFSWRTNQSSKIYRQPCLSGIATPDDIWNNNSIKNTCSY